MNLQKNENIIPIKLKRRRFHARVWHIYRNYRTFMKAGRLQALYFTWLTVFSVPCEYTPRNKKRPAK